MISGKYITITLSLIMIVRIGVAQPTLNYTELKLPHKLKYIRTLVYSTEDTTQSKGILAYEAKFDTAGRIVWELRLIMGDVVPYQYKTTFRYDAAGNLTSRVDSQQMRPLTETDSATLQSLGNDVTHRQYLYSYDQTNHKVQELEFWSSNPSQIPPLPEVKRVYSYNQQGLLASEIVIHPIAKKSNENPIFGLMACTESIVQYAYDAAGRKIREATRCNDDPDHDQDISTWQYDIDGIMKETTFTESSASPDKYYRTVYDSHEQEVQRYRKEGGTESLYLTHAYVYDAEDRLLADETTHIYAPGNVYVFNTIYDYCKNGLICKELIKSRKMITHYITTYAFYPD